MKINIFTPKEALPLFIILIMIITGIGVYTSPCVPSQMPVHWNALGEIDGWSGKGFALLFFPGLALAIYLLTTFLPLADPFRKNYAGFSKNYFLIRLFIILFLSLIYFYSVGAGLGLVKFNIKYSIIPAISLLILGIGFLSRKVKMNFFVGFRTPWTLQSDEVWEKTHEFGGKLFIIAGILSFLTVFFGAFSFLIFMVLIISASIAPIVYSYLLYRKMGLFHKK